MPDIAKISFPTYGKLYNFSVTGLELRQGDTVVVESELGLSLGKVVSLEKDAEAGERELKPVLRVATENDFIEEKSNESLKKEGFVFCQERITARGLAMKLVSTDCTLDRKKIIFYFVANTRIDFRELVKDLAAKFRTRIELRQIGVRDEARITGTLGICGRSLCCRTFLTNFEPISIRMAKRQELALNTSKLSGTCGRLMCCLNYEVYVYNKEEDAVAVEHETAAESGASGAADKSVTITEIISSIPEETKEEKPVSERPKRAEDIRHAGQAVRHHHVRRPRPEHKPHGQKTQEHKASEIKDAAQKEKDKTLQKNLPNPRHKKRFFKRPPKTQ